MFSLIGLVSLIFIFHGYLAEREALLSGIDQKLYTSAIMLEYILPNGYHDGINNNSYNSENYSNLIVYKNSQICGELGLQYLWSNIVSNGEIVFTSSSSPTKNISNKDYAEFFSAHSDPDAFYDAFSTMQVTYSSFKNEWGNGRMVLIPRVDNNGRKYVLGASMGTNEVRYILLKTFIRDFFFLAFALIVGFLISMIISKHFTSRIITLADFANRFKKGDEVGKLKVSNGDEIGELANTLNIAVGSAKENEKKLERQKNELDKRVRIRTAELEKFNQAAINRELKMIELKKKIKQLEGEKK